MKREASSSSFSPPFLSGVPALKGGHTFYKSISEKGFGKRNGKSLLRLPRLPYGRLASMGIGF
jgi:hypothetical protein